MGIIDFHSHVLPGIDDGSRSENMSRQMLEESARQGVEVMVATPHFYGDRDTINHFLRKRSEALEKVLPSAEELGIQLIAGAEVAYFDNMSQAEGIDRLTMGGSRIMLIEMPFRQWTRRDLQELERLLNNGYQLILAHVERYLSFQSDKSVLEAIWGKPILIQLNAESLPGFWNGQKSIKLFKDGKAHLLGSDCHNLSSRPPNLAVGRAVIGKKIGQHKLTQIDRLGERLLEEILMQHFLS